MFTIVRDGAMAEVLYKPGDQIILKRSAEKAVVLRVLPEGRLEVKAETGWQEPRVARADEVRLLDPTRGT